MHRSATGSFGGSSSFIPIPPEQKVPVARWQCPPPPAVRSGDRCPAPHRRSARAKAAFRKRVPCPSTGEYRGACPGWVVDHVVALKRCGKDAASNMAWRTVEDSKMKDR